MKVDGIVPGANEWDRPRLMAMFHNAAGTQVGDVGVVSVPAIEGWQNIAGTVSVPAGVTSVAFCVGLQDCAGTMLIAAPSCLTVE